MAANEFDHERWPDELRALAAAQAEASRAFLDNMDDENLRAELETAGKRFREAHRVWLRENPDRIPGLIAHRLRQQRRPRTYLGYDDYEMAERIRERERAQIEELWELHRDALHDSSVTEAEEPTAPVAATEPSKYTVEVTTVRSGFRTTAFGVYDTAEEAEGLGDRWRQDARAEGLTDLSISVREIHDVSAYAPWVNPERRRARAERVAQNLAARRTRLLLEFHDDEAIKELAPQIIADAVTQTGRFEVTSPADTVASYRRAAHAAGRLLQKPLATSERSSPDGTVITVVVRTRIDLNEYRAKHGRTPRGQGMWVMRSSETGEVLTINGTWGEVRNTVPGGNWTLEP